MAISTYANLKTALETWLARSGDADVVANAADCIAMGESRLNRVLPLRTMWRDTNLTSTIGSRLITLPTDYVEPVALFLITGSVTTGIHSPLKAFVQGTVTLSTTRKAPTAWAIAGDSISLDAPSDQVYNFFFRYRQSFALSDSATTNWLLTNHPDCYLAAAMVHAAMLVRDSEAIQIWQSALNQHIEEISEKDARSMAIATLFVDPALTADLSTPGFFDFTSGT